MPCEKKSANTIDQTMTPYVLNTCRLVLQPVQTEEAAELHAIFAQADVYRYLTDGVPMPLSWVEDIIRDSDTTFQERGLGLWSVREHGARPIIGLTGFHHFYHPPVFELIYALRPAYWHRGLATEMAQAVIAYAFTHRRLCTIRASTDEPNHASARVMARLGMRPHGRTSMTDASDIGWDQLHFILSYEDWRARH
jgi:RimJ/RimL family protein N-acetyltransferase